MQIKYLQCLSTYCLSILEIAKYVLCVIVFLSGFAQADWHDRKAEGWVWFEEKADPKTSKPQEEIVPQRKSIAEKIRSKAIKKDPEKELETFKKELESALKVATWDPTPENVAAYQQLQLIALEKSIEFSRIWQQNLLNDPSLDSSIDAPSSYYGTQLKKAIRQQEKEEQLKDLAQHYALLFFYEGANLTSQATSQIVKRFAKTYQFELYGVTCDQTLIENLLNQAIGQPSIEALKITTLPSLFAINPDNQRLIPIAYGMVAQEKIEENLLMQLSKVKVSHVSY